MKHSQRGYSLIELSIALAIIAVVIAGAVTGVQSILRSNNVNKTVLQTNNAVGKIIAKMVRDSTYADATLQKLTVTGYDIWPDSAVSGGGTSTAAVYHPFGGKVLLASLSADSNGVTTGQGLVYTLTGIPVAACVDVALGLESLATAMSITNQAAVATAPTLPTSTDVVKDANSGTKLTANAAQTKCAGSAGTATIILLIPRG